MHHQNTISVFQQRWTHTCWKVSFLFCWRASTNVCTPSLSASQTSNSSPLKASFICHGFKESVPSITLLRLFKWPAQVELVCTVWQHLFNLSDFVNRIHKNLLNSSLRWRILNSNIKHQQEINAVIIQKCVLVCGYVHLYVCVCKFVCRCMHGLYIWVCRSCACD